MKCAALLLALAALPSGALAQAPLPQKHIPASVLMELRMLESQFDVALGHDCAPERCVSKGCVYGDHMVLDTPRSSSLPGIAQSEGPGSVPPQEFLTQARCDFAHEKSVAPRDALALVKRLEQRLSRGWLRVTVGHQILEPISADLGVSPKSAETEPAPKAEPAVAPQPPAAWERGVAARELWLKLLPHFFWMIGLVLATVAGLVFVWALRRLGRETVEEKALQAQLASGALADAKKPDAEPPAQEPPADAGRPAIPLDKDAEEAAFANAQRQIWRERIAHSELGRDEGAVMAMLRQWLKAGELDLLAKSIVVFGDQLTLAFPADGELAVRKVELADYLRTLDERKLPSDAEFFRTLNHHAISASLLAQPDAATYRSLQEEFGGVGVAHLIGSLPPRHGALLFALAPADLQREVARTLAPEVRLQVVGELLLSNRISQEEQAHIFQALDAARLGKPLPPPPPPAQNRILDRGREVDAPGAMSVLFPLLDAHSRQALFDEALQRSSGELPHWYQDIFFPEMLLKVTPELQADLLLDVDIKGLAGWYSVQHPAWQESFIGRLGASMQNAVRANMSFESRADQLRMARRGHVELVAALKRAVARGKVSFTELVA